MMTRVGASVVILAVVSCCLLLQNARGQDGGHCKGDFNGDNRVSIDELVTAVNNALSGCPVPPTTPSVTPSGAPTATPTNIPTVLPTGTATATATHTPTCVPQEEICDGLDNDCDCPGDTNEDDIVCGPGDEGVDEGGVCGIECPAGMVPVGSQFCIDKYECSRPDATAQDAGVDESVATSRLGVLPWAVNPMTYEHLLTFQVACEAAGKHLCSKEEWFAACQGPAPGTTYVYGDTFDRETCNCVDTFCDDYCADHGIPPAQCNTGTNCGYGYYCFRQVPTGTFLGCTNEYGTFDINGNLWEVVPSDSDPRGYEVRGGAFNCASAAVRLQCTYNAGWAELYAGFRCCYVP